MDGGSSLLPDIVPQGDRLQALERYDILDTPREKSFDRIANLIQVIFNVPIGIVSMIDGHRQWYKASTGMSNNEADLKHTFCRFALEGSAPLVIPDATKDDRVSNNPYVTGQPNIRFYAGVPLRTKDGHNIGTVCAIGLEPRTFTAQQAEILSSLAQIVMDELELRQLATLDGLTGISSHRAIKDEGGRLMALARRHSQPLSCVVFDLDHFKSINDEFGHATGDTVLVEIAKVAQLALRQTDLLGRLGGEEFIALLPQTAQSAALTVAEKIRSSIEQIKHPPPGPAWVTASFGIAALDSSIADLDTLIIKADKAMYEAKAKGRNRSVAWKNSEPARLPRRRVLKAGRIIFNAKTSAINCTVRSFAADGAGVDVISAIGIPPEFVLQIRSDGFESNCRVHAQTDKHLEVEFC